MLWSYFLPVMHLLYAWLLARTVNGWRLASRAIISTVPRTNLLWNLKTMERALPEVLHDRRYGAQLACFHPSGRFIAVANNADVVRLLDISSGKFLAGPFTQHRQVTAFTFSNDGKLLITAGFSASLCITDITQYIS